MPVYKDDTKKKNKFWYEFEAGKNALTGKREKIRKKGFATEKEAKAAMVKAMDEFNEGEYIEPSRMKLLEYLLNTWLPVKKMSNETKKMYEGYIKNHIQTHSIANEEISKLSVVGIQTFVTLLESKNLAPNSVKKMYSILNTALNDAVTMQIIKINPAKSIINKPKEVSTQKTVWNEEEIKKFVEESEGKSRYSLVFRFTLMTGCRQGEVLGLRWQDIDFNENILRITQTLTHDGKNIKQGAKTKKSVRPIMFDAKTKVELLKQYNIIQQEKHELGKEYKDNDLVFCTSKGTPVTPRNVMRAFYGLLKDIDVPKVTFHELRHTQATILLSHNVHPKIVSERLGHSTIRITLDTYSHMLPNMQDSAVKSLENIL